jgi:thermostable 8-oxoguanine DNA glycosylase
MNLLWDFNTRDINRWKEFIKDNIDNEFVLDRVEQNLNRKHVVLSKKRLWYVHIGCQVTTQQRSGPDSLVSIFLDSDSRALNYKKCAETKNLESLLRNEFKKANLRRSNVMAKYLAEIFKQLEGGEWEILSSHLKSLLKRTTKNKERKVAQYISGSFKGLGPKQSRNYIQWLGLSRYEIPLDSRITKTMKKLGFEFVPKANALSDEVVYQLIEDGLQELSKKLGIYPCILDACIFSSFDVKNA